MVKAEPHNGHRRHADVQPWQYREAALRMHIHQLELALCASLSHLERETIIRGWNQTQAANLREAVAELHRDNARSWAESRRLRAYLVVALIAVALATLVALTALGVFQ